MWCQLLYLIPGAILCSKSKYSNVTSMKSLLPQSFSFLSFFLRKSSKMENTQSNCVRTYQFWSPSPCTHPCAFVMTPHSSYLRTQFLDGPLLSEHSTNNIINYLLIFQIPEFKCFILVSGMYHSCWMFWHIKK